MSETETETPDEPETEPEPETTEEDEEQESQPSESQLAAERAAEENEAYTKEWKAANLAYRKRLTKLTGLDLSEFECPTCSGDGFLEPGAQVEIPLERKLDAAECPTCKGYGQLLTPSKVEGHMLATCNNCAGAGWIAASAPTNVVDLPAPAGQAPAQPQVGEFIPGVGFKPFGSDEVIPLGVQAG